MVCAAALVPARSVAGPSDSRPRTTAAVPPTTNLMYHAPVVTTTSANQARRPYANATVAWPCRSASVLPLLVALALLVGCGQTNAFLIAGPAKNRIQPGATHQSDVKDLLGDPDLTTPLAEGHLWLYNTLPAGKVAQVFGRAAVGGSHRSHRSDGRTFMLLIHFDADSTVRDYKLNQTTLPAQIR
jgi:hypothetical protein